MRYQAIFTIASLPCLAISSLSCHNSYGHYHAFVDIYSQSIPELKHAHLAAMSSSGKYIAIVDSMGLLHIGYSSDMRGYRIRKLGGVNDIRQLAFRESDSSLLTTNSNGDIIVYDIETGKIKNGLHIFNDPISCLDMMRTGTRIVLGTYKGDIVVLGRKYSEEARFKVGKVLLSIKIDKEKDAVVCGYLNGQISLYSLLNGAHIYDSFGIGPIQSICISKNGDYFATSGDGVWIDVWERRTRRKAAVLKGHNSRVIFMEYLEDNELISIERNGDAILWDVNKSSIILSRKNWNCLAAGMSSRGEVMLFRTDGMLQIITRRAQKLPMQKPGADQKTDNSP